MNYKSKFSAVFILSLLGNNGAFAQSQRPPQHVLLAFDGCILNNSWKEVHDLMDAMNTIDDHKLKFTFLISAVALLTDSNKNAYINPSVKMRESSQVERNPELSMFIERARKLKAGKEFPSRGVSNINWGGSLAELKTRVDFINSAIEKGNEIGSHAVGHFQGKTWSAELWDHEFAEFNKIFDNVGSINGDPSIKLNMKSSEVVGFRAPFLGGIADRKGPALLKVLQKYNYRYDTSDNNMGYEKSNWPQKYDLPGTNLWNFGLAFIDVFGKLPNGSVNVLTKSDGKPVRTMSMDYNFCVLQEPLKPYNPEKPDADRKGWCMETNPNHFNNASDDGYYMLLSYLKYFVDNYNGNRAPIHIGHHFTPYRGPHYNRAMYAFAKIVCELPEVECTTYEKLSDFMDGLHSTTHKDLQLGKFPKSDFQPTMNQLVSQVKWSSQGPIVDRNSTSGRTPTPPRPTAPRPTSSTSPIRVTPVPPTPSIKKLSQPEIASLSSQVGQSAGNIISCPWSKSEVKPFETINSGLMNVLQNVYSNVCNQGINSFSSDEAIRLRDLTGRNFSNSYQETSKFSGAEVRSFSQTWGAATSQVVELATRNGANCSERISLSPQLVNSLGAGISSVQKACLSKFGLMGKRR